MKILTERLIIPTASGFRDMLRTTVTNNDSKVALLHLPNEDYRLHNNQLYHRGSVLNTEQLLSLVSNPSENKPLKEPVLPYGIFSFMYSKGDLRNDARIETTENELCSFLGVSTGYNGFRLIEKLLHYQYVYGVIPSKGVMPLLQLDMHHNGKIVITSEYLHHVLNMMLTECFDKYGQRGRYYTNKIHADLVSVRNKPAAMVAIELSRIIVTSGKYGKPHITLQELVRAIPQLRAILLSTQQTSYKNRQLKRTFESLIEILQNKTELYTEFSKLEVHLPEQLLFSKLKAVIRVTHKGYKGA